MELCNNIPLFLIISFVLLHGLSIGQTFQNSIDSFFSNFGDEGECPRKPTLIRNRKCYKKCNTDEDCRGRNKQCLCDDVCGKSCVKPSKPCKLLKAVINGRHEIKPYNTFGAKVRYHCSPGYILNGLPERVCQGDGYWSGEAPTCESEDNFPALSGKCLNPPLVEHAVHDGPIGQKIFPLGTQLTYSCENGYNIDGFFRAMCVGEGRWVGPRMTCSPRHCEHPGDIPNGNREGNIFIYPNRVTYGCTEGYELIGRPYRVCQADGSWSGSTPTCKPVTCPPLGTPENGRVEGKEFTYGSVVKFSCYTGFELTGSSTRKCQQDGRWSGRPAACKMVNCGYPERFYNGELDGAQTTFGSVIRFRCFSTATMDMADSDTAKCQEDGTWSNPVPLCWSKCPRVSISNGSIEDNSESRYYNHEQVVDMKCQNGFRDVGSRGTSQCINGTWSYVPDCQPSKCTTLRPDDIRDGMVRFHGVDHGDKAKYICNPGFKLIGDSFQTCQYGDWRGKMPYCDPVYCPYPGTLKNGNILLIGVIGKYEYRSYVRKVDHNENIEYLCDKGYTKIGYSAATCIDGRWSPDKKPRCVKKQHLEALYIYRGKRHTGNKNASYTVYH